MPETYTPPTGNTPQGLDLESLNTALSKITGQASGNPVGQADPLQSGMQANQLASAAQANMPNFNSQQATGLFNQSQIPQATQGYNMDVNTFMKMMQADKGFATQYYNPNYQNASDAVGNTTGTDPKAPGVVGATPQLTMGNVNQPFQGTPDYGLASSLGSLNASALTGHANNIMNLIANNLQKMQGQYNINTGEYSSQVQALQNVANYMMNAAQMQEQQRQFDVSTGLNTNPLAGGDPSTDTSLTYDQKLQKLQDAIDNAPNADAQAKYQKIRDSYVKSHALSPQETTSYQATTSTLNDIQLIDDAFSDPKTSAELKKVMGSGAQSNAIKWAIQNGQFELLPIFGLSGVDGQRLGQILSAMNNVNVVRDRSMLGGRVTGYLLGALGAGNLDFNKSLEENKGSLDVAKSHILENLNIYSKNKGMAITDLPGIESYMPYINQQTGNTDPLKNKKTKGGNNDPLGILN